MTDEEQEGNYPQVLGFILTFAQSEKAMHFYFEEPFSFKGHLDAVLHKNT